MKKKNFLAAFAAICLCACSGNSQKGNAPEVDTLQIDEVATLDEAVDAAVEDVVADLNKTLESGDTETLKKEIESVSEQIVELVKGGDAQKAIEYADQVKKFVVDNEEKLKQLQKEGNATAQGLMEVLKELPGMAEEVAQEAEETAKEAAASADQAAQQKANEKLEEAKQKAADALKKAAEKLNNK